MKHTTISTKQPFFALFSSLSPRMPHRAMAVITLIAVMISFGFPQQNTQAATTTSKRKNLVMSDTELLQELPDDKLVEKPVNKIKVRAYAYSSTPDQTDDTPFITANGMTVYDGLIAANFLPFGTKVKIPEIFGDKLFTVNDRMNARYRHGIIDIWHPTRRAAKQFGVKHVVIEIHE